VATGGVEWSGVEWSLGCYDWCFFFLFLRTGFRFSRGFRETRDVFFPMAGKQTRLFNLNMDIDR